MKSGYLRKILTALICVLMLFSFSFASYASVLGDRIKEGISKLGEDYKTSVQPDGKLSNDLLRQRWKDLRDKINNTDNEQVRNSMLDLLKAFGLDKDLANISDSEFGKILQNFGGPGGFNQFLKLATEAMSSGTKMIRDVIRRGSGTADGKNTADNTTQVVVTPSIRTPATVVRQPQPVVQQQVTAPPVPVERAEPVTEPILGAGLSPQENSPNKQANVQENMKRPMSASSMTVLLILSFSTIAVIVTIVIFFILKRKNA